MADPASDHAEIHDDLSARRYFAKFDRILGHMPRVAVELERDGHLTRAELRQIGGDMASLQRSSQALSLKYLMTGRTQGPGIRQRQAFDRQKAAFRWLPDCCSWPMKPRRRQAISTRSHPRPISRTA